MLLLLGLVVDDIQAVIILPGESGTDRIGLASKAGFRVREWNRIEVKAVSSEGRTESR